MKVAGLFAGIGGIELGLKRALGDQMETELLCESWEPAKEVLQKRFPHVPVHPDVRDLRSLPSDLDVLAAGFPCTDLSQAGRTAGISGVQSGLVAHVFEVLRRQAAMGGEPPTILMENVPNMLALDRGKAMRFLVTELESLGYRWAYRVVDSRFTGLPQRRRRVLLLASTRADPRAVLFGQDAGPLDETALSDSAYGFSWTEGRGGLGWARDAVPTLKGGSTIGIPSPPAIWVRGADPDRLIVTPTIEDAEALQGFDRGWTRVGSHDDRRNGPRWKLVGNAVTTRVAEWVAGQLVEPGSFELESSVIEPARAWPTAAWGEKGRIWTVPVSEFPVLQAYQSLRDVVDVDAAPGLSRRAISGFRSRLVQGNLGRTPGFREAVDQYVEAVGTPGSAVPA